MQRGCLRPSAEAPPPPLAPGLQGLTAQDVVLLAAGLRRAAPLPRVCRLGHNRVCWAGAGPAAEFSTQGVEALVAALQQHAHRGAPGVVELDLGGNFLGAAGLTAAAPLTGCVRTLRLEVSHTDRQPHLCLPWVLQLTGCVRTLRLEVSTRIVSPTFVCPAS
jgi:hypothetical protein